jgi:2-C-methyl-D-erythritol 4-phosphate cytidylyltransferase
MILYSIDRFSNDPDCEEIIVVHSLLDAAKMTLLTKNNPCVKLVQGGDSRQQSVFAGLKLVRAKYVLIHDGARPNLKKAQLEELKKAVKEKLAATLVVPLKETLVVTDNDHISYFIDRTKSFVVQTPQAFLTEDILKAHILCNHSGTLYTDDASVYLNTFNKDVKVVIGDEENLKVTTKADLLLMEGLL